MAIAYGHYTLENQLRGECDTEFMWVTSHPFLLSGWPELAGIKKIKQAYDEDKGVNSWADWDDERARALADRVWVLVWTERQATRLSLTSTELANALSALSRRENGLWRP